MGMLDYFERIAAIKQKLSYTLWYKNLFYLPKNIDPKECKPIFKNINLYIFLLKVQIKVN